MNIWDELYGNFVVSQNKSDGKDDEYLTVEAKVEELRRRVGLVVQTGNGAGDMQKSASEEFSQALVDIVSAAIALSKKPMADSIAVLKRLEDIFPEHQDLIANNQEYIMERISGPVAKKVLTDFNEKPEEIKNETEELFPVIPHSVKR